MIKILIKKELKTILISPKFSAIFAICSILILLSVYVGIQDYRASMAHYETANSLTDQELHNQKNWSYLNTTITLRPDPMQIFVSGINNDIGRQASIQRSQTIKLTRSNYADNTIFAVFRSMDLMFIFQIVLSLFAILFTYDAINGEREKGTLKLSFANPLPRNAYIAAKLTGSWLGLVIPLLIPLLLGVALVLVYRIPMSGVHWFRLGLFLSLSVVYFSLFICLGVLVSSLTRRSSVSFLYLLVIWVAFVLVIPRGGVMIAGNFISVPTAAEISSKLSQNSEQLYDQLTARSQKRSQELMPKLQSIYTSSAPEERGAKIDELYAELSKKNDEDQEKTLQEIKKYDVTLNEDWRNRKLEREKLGFSLSRFSPASAYQLASMDTAETGLNLKNKYEDQLRSYRDVLGKYGAQKEAKSDDQARMSGSMKEQKPLNLSDMPKFKFIKTDLDKVMHRNVIDIGILSLYIMISIAGTFVAFNRYDVR